MERFFLEQNVSNFCPRARVANLTKSGERDGHHTIQEERLQQHVAKHALRTDYSLLRSGIYPSVDVPSPVNTLWTLNQKLDTTQGATIANGNLADHDASYT